MRKYLLTLPGALATFSLLLAACGTAQTPTPRRVVQTLIVQVTPTPDLSQPTAASTGLSAGMPPGSVQINGAGATFPFPLYSKWFYD